MSEQFDLFIEEIEIVDGSGRPPFSGSIGISGERIETLGSSAGGPAGSASGRAGRVINGRGLTACPGFVDSHSHADLTILKNPPAENLVMQGITTFVGGHCGISLAPLSDPSYFEDLKKTWGLDFEPDWRTFGEWLEAVDDCGIGINYLPLLGHNAVRGAVLGGENKREALSGEVADMEKHIREAMESGAFGLSMGLDANSPGHFSNRSELLRMLAIVKEYGGVFSPHTRHHQNQWPSDSAGENAYGLYQGPRGELFTGRYHGLLEALELTRLTGNIKLLIAHLTPSYSVPQPHPGYLDEALARATLEEIIERPLDEGQNVFFNVIPCEYSIGSRLPVIASFFNRNLLLPDWLEALSREQFASRLGDPDFRARVRDFVLSGRFKFGMLNPVTDPYWMDCYRILTCRKPDLIGKTVGEIARERSPEDIVKTVFIESLELVFDIIAEDPEATWALVRDKREYGVVSTFLSHPKAIPMTDVHAAAADPENARGIFGYGISPSAFNMFPNYLARFVKKDTVLSLEEAVRRITSLPADEVFGLKDRGRIERGMFADLVILDPEKLEITDTFTRPNTAPPGIECVIVNGKVAYEKGTHSGTKSGKVLRKS